MLNGGLCLRVSGQQMTKDSFFSALRFLSSRSAGCFSDKGGAGSQTSQAVGGDTRRRYQITQRKKMVSFEMGFRDFFLFNNWVFVVPSEQERDATYDYKYISRFHYFGVVLYEQRLFLFDYFLHLYF